MEPTDNHRQSLVDQQLVQNIYHPERLKQSVQTHIFRMYIIRTCRTYCVVNSNID